LRRFQINEQLGRTPARLVNLPNAPINRGSAWNDDLFVYDDIKGDLKFHGLSELRVFLVQAFRQAEYHWGVRGQDWRA